MTPYYDEGGVRIYHGDCREILPELESFDLVVTDPPYGINTKSDGNRKLSPWADLCNASLWYELWIGEVRKRLSPRGALWSFLNWRSLVTFQKASCSLRWPIESLLVWDKEWIGPGGTRGLRPSYELVALFPGELFSIDDRGLPDIRREKWSSKKPKADTPRRNRSAWRAGWSTSPAGSPSSIPSPAPGPPWSRPSHSDGRPSELR